MKKIGLSIVCFMGLILALKSYADCVADPSSDISNCGSGCISTTHCHNYTYSPSCGQCDGEGGCTPDVHSSTKTDQQGTCVPGGHIGVGQDVCECGMAGESTTSTISCGCSP